MTASPFQATSLQKAQNALFPNHRGCNCLCAMEGSAPSATEITPYAFLLNLTDTTQEFPCPAMCRPAQVAAVIAKRAMPTVGSCPYLAADRRL